MIYLTRTSNENNKTISYLYAKEYENTDISVKKGILIIDLYTVEEYRGQGLASSLIKELIKKYKGVYHYIILDDCSGEEPPYNIYHKFGFMIRSFNDTTHIKEWKKWEEDDSPDEERIFFL